MSSLKLILQVCHESLVKNRFQLIQGDVILCCLFLLKVSSSLNINHMLLQAPSDLRDSSHFQTMSHNTVQKICSSSSSHHHSIICQKVTNP